MRRAEGAAGKPSGASSIFGREGGWESNALFPHQRMEGRGPSPRARATSPQAEETPARSARTSGKARTAGCWSETLTANSPSRGETLFTSPRRMASQGEFSAKFRSGQSPLRFSGDATEESHVSSRLTDRRSPRENAFGVMSSKEAYRQDMLTSAITFGDEGGKPAEGDIVSGGGWVSHARMTKKGRRGPSPETVPSRATIGGTKTTKGDWMEKMPSAATARKSSVVHELAEKGHLPATDGGVTQKDALWRKLPEYSSCGNYLVATGRSHKASVEDDADQKRPATQMYKMHMSGSTPSLLDMRKPGATVETPSLHGSEAGDQDQRSPSQSRERYNKHFGTKIFGNSGPSPRSLRASKSAAALPSGNGSINVEAKNVIAETAPALASSTNGGSGGFLDAAEKKLAEWQSFKERHGPELQAIIQKRGYGMPSENDRLLYAENDIPTLQVDSKEPVCVASQVWSMRAPDKRRDAKCPIRASSMTDLSLQKNLAMYGVHPVAPRSFVAPAVGPAGRRYHQAPAQWKY